jgi:hypothetical protein
LVSFFKLRNLGRNEFPYYFSTHGCFLAFCLLSSVFGADDPFVAAAAFRALMSKKLAIMEDYWVVVEWRV